MTACDCHGADLSLLILDTTDGALFLTTHHGEETGMARVGKGKAQKCARNLSDLVTNAFADAMRSKGMRNVSEWLTLDTAHADRAIEVAHLDRFTNDSITGRFETYCGRCGAHLSKVGYGPGTVTEVPAFINISGLTGDADYALARDAAGRASLDRHAVRLV